LGRGCWHQAVPSLLYSAEPWTLAGCVRGTFVVYSVYRNTLLADCVQRTVAIRQFLLEGNERLHAVQREQTAVY